MTAASPAPAGAPAAASPAPAPQPGRLARFWAAFTAVPSYPGSEADRRTLRIMGVDLPLRATVAVFVATIVELFDYTRTAIPGPVLDLYLAAPALRYQALVRVILFGLVPVLVILLAFRDRPSRYGLRLGDWRWGLAMSLVGMAIMTPIVLLLANDPAFGNYYWLMRASPTDVAITSAIDLTPTEFVFRGFLMFTLIRSIGPLGLVIAQLPFVFAHLSKPELELFSTLIGGLVFGWVNLRTGSILWSVIPHVWILSLAIVAVAAFHPGA